MPSRSGSCRKIPPCYGFTAASGISAKQRQLDQIENLIASTRTNIGVLRLQREELQGKAAAQQRAGREVDEMIIREIGEIDAEMQRLERVIAAKQQEIEEVEANFEVSRARLEELLDS